jgi:hypothetical protein
MTPPRVARQNLATTLHTGKDHYRRRLSLDARPIILVDSTGPPIIEPVHGGPIGRLGAGDAAYAKPSAPSALIPCSGCPRCGIMQRWKLNVNAIIEFSNASVRP